MPEYRRTQILVNASNLHKGGGVQVAGSLLQEFSKFKHVANRLHVVASSEVTRYLEAVGANVSAFRAFETRDARGFSFLDLHMMRLAKTSEITLTIFGPIYWLRKPRRSVVGFAQPWIIYPKNEVYPRLSVTARLATRIKFGIQRFMFVRNSDYLIGEAPHVRNGAVANMQFPASKVFVISNCVSEIFRKAEAPGRPSRTPRRPFRIGFLGRDYPHKNLGILPETRHILREKFNLDVEFVVALTDDEWNARPETFRQAVTNVGPVPELKGPEFYSSMDAIIFPSLLECFSATPLEAMVMRRPLIASDRQFVRDFCHDHATYFDPLDAHDISKTVARVAADYSNQARQRLERARQHALSLATPTKRAEAYIEALLGPSAFPSPAMRPGDV